MSNNSTPTTATPAPLFYLAALNAAEGVGMLVAQLVTLLLMGTLLVLWLCSHRWLKKMSDSMVFFLIGHALGNATTLPYTLQVCINKKKPPMSW
jgi:predicted permease